MWKTLLRIVLATAGLFGAVMCWGLSDRFLGRFSGDLWITWPPYRPMITSLVYIVSALALAWLLQVKLDRQPFALMGFMARWPRALGHLLCGILLGGAGVAVVILAQWGLGAIELDYYLWDRPEILPFSRPVWAYVAGGFFTALAIGFAEELFFRGYGLQMARRRHNLVAGVAVGSVAFSAMHFLGAILNPLAALNIILVAVLFSLMVLVHGNLWVAIGFHTAWDWVQFNLLHVTGEGTGGHRGLLMFSHAPTGSALISGGSYWPEGSLLVTLVIGLLTAVYGYLLYRRAGAPAAAQDNAA